MKFKIGDKIRVKKSLYDTIKRGDEGEIHSITNNYFYYLNIEEVKYNYPFYRSELELLEPTYKIYRRKNEI